MGRTSLRFALETCGGDALPIYGPEAEANLAQLVGQNVRIRGRLVDLSAEGFGIELWVAAVD